MSVHFFFTIKIAHISTNIGTQFLGEDSSGLFSGVENNAKSYLPPNTNSSRALFYPSPHYSRESPNKSQDLLQFTSHDFRQSPNPLEGPSFVSIQYREKTRTQEPVFLVSGASNRLKSDKDLKVRRIERDNKSDLKAVSAYKLIRSVSSKPIRSKNEVELFRRGRNVINRLVKATNSAMRQGTALKERREKVDEARAWSHARADVRERDKQSYISYLAAQSRLHKMCSELNLQRQRFLDTQETQVLKSSAQRSRAPPHPHLSVQNLDSKALQPRSDSSFSMRDLRSLLMSSGKERKRWIS